MAESKEVREIERKRRLRTQFMRWLYDATDGSQDRLVEPAEFIAAQRDSVLEADVRSAIRYLEGEYLLKAHWTMGGLPSMQITHRGITEMEQALSTPDRPTKHFSPINVLQVFGNVVNSQLQQNSPGAQQSQFTSVNEISELQAFLLAAREAIKSPGFDDAFTDRASADLDALETEADRPNPNWKLLRAIGQSAKTVIESALGGVLTEELKNIAWPTFG